MDPQFSLGGPHPTPRNGTRREGPKVQINPQRPTPAGMELARGDEQGRGGMHHFSTHRHQNKLLEHPEYATLALEGIGAHT
ncbi:unnamed protein product [Sphagnum jensenii]